MLIVKDEVIEERAKSDRLLKNKREIFVCI